MCSERRYAQAYVSAAHKWCIFHISIYSICVRAIRSMAADVRCVLCSAPGSGGGGDGGLSECAA